jgi:hypothetical protein
MNHLESDAMYDLNSRRNGPRPVFLVSLPRSGSTLLQKMLAVNPEVATAAEPWICLPLATMLDRTTIVAEYWHGTCHQALADLVGELPGGKPEFLRMLGTFVEELYRRIAGDSGASVFIDKTPRYYLIVPFLAEAFPTARFVFLFRNPVEVLASILKTWHKDRFGPELMGNWVDIVRGPSAMAEGYRLLGDRALGIQYSHLVAEPEAVVNEVCTHLEIAFSEDMLTRYRDVKFAGRMGDPIGVKRYESVSTASLEKWRSFVSNRYRKAYIMRYLREMGPDVLATFGIDMNEMLAETIAIPAGLDGSLADALGMRRLRRAIRENARQVGPVWNRKNRRRPLVPYG